MLAFVIRRLIGMVLVLVAVSFLVFVIFIVVPGGDPATRIAGKNANDQLIENIRHTWGFDQPFYDAVLDHDEEDVHGRSRLVHESDERRSEQIKAGLPATFSLAIGAAIIWLFFGIARRDRGGCHRGAGGPIG